ncbi:spore germination protein (amino acid permease) [Paenibacillus cellulosilyticus]|uniref:Spore germination protein (Amino acid permease) n=1 Tax=Paenibacillus cellulosilyticus TaxID=375489 RepID=A0A2V2YUE5_9BACL|nr:GerAB/ArcD/ProY family transporter [Paenibacillus cellulosilyticus]PWW04781.1 spore germination protein (amino acid permease) [Paenibacillus cellulosilyticus]QKS45904.1 GerAB/ArcD/ProY family transporter [Paenibacillus cellulosilyticus]
MIHLKQLSTQQLTCLVILTQVGVHVLSIPFNESRHSGHDAWMSILFGGVVAQAVIVIIYWLGKRHPNQSLPQYMGVVVGKPIGVLVNLLFAAYCAESCLLVTVSYTDVIERWLLVTTPWYVILGLSIAIAAYIASSPLRSIAVVTQSIMFMFLVCVVIVLTSGTGQGDYRHLLPIGTHGIGAIIRDSIPALWLYAGYELLLYVFPFVKSHRHKDIVIAMTIANGVTTLFYVVLSMLVTYKFSESQINTIAEPLVFILRQFNWPVVQSLDILFITIWLAVVAVTAYMYLFLSARYLAHIFRNEIRKHTMLVWLLGGICFIVGLWGEDREKVIRFTVYHNYATGIMVIIMPTLLLLISLMRGRGSVVR